MGDFVDIIDIIDIIEVNVVTKVNTIITVNMVIIALLIAFAAAREIENIRGPSSVPVSESFYKIKPLNQNP